jgi:hypothetical protein
MLYHGPVRAPMDAARGAAIVRVEMPADSPFASVATDLQVVIE